MTMVGLPGGSITLSDQLLPYTDDSSNDGTGRGHTYGILTLNVSDAIPGSVLTINVGNHYQGVSDSSFGTIGVQAVTVVPEVSSSLLGALALVGFAARRKR